MDRGEYRDTGHKSVGSRALLALLPLAIYLGCCTTRGVWGKKTGNRNIPQHTIFICFPTILLSIIAFYQFVRYCT